MAGVSEIFYVEVPDVDHDLAHLFEHVLLSEFDEFLKNRGVELATWGWINGRTFDEAIVLDCYFFDEKNKAEFERFYKEFAIDENAIRREAKLIEAEEGVLMKYDVVAVEQELSELRKRPLSSVKNLAKPLYIPRPQIDKLREKLFNKRRASNSFDLLNISIEADDLAPAEVATMLFIYILVDEIVSDALHDFAAYYKGGSSISDTNADSIRLSYNFDIRKNSYKVADIDKKLRTALASYRIDGRDVESQLVRKSPALLVEFFERTGNLMSWDAYEKCLTAKNVNGALAKTVLRHVEKAE